MRRAARAIEMVIIAALITLSAALSISHWLS